MVQASQMHVVIPVLFHIYKVSGTKGYRSLKTHFSGNHVLKFSASLSLHSSASHPLLHLSSDSSSSLCLCVSSLSPPPLSLSLPFFHLPSYWAISLPVQWINFTEFFLCIKGRQCVSGDEGGQSKPRFNLPSFSPHVLLWALSAITGQYLAKWNDLPPSLVLNHARGLWHSFGLFLAVSLPWLYWLNVTLRQRRT